MIEFLVHSRFDYNLGINKFLIFSFILFLLIAYKTNAQRKDDPIKSTCDKGINYLLQEDYIKADSTFSSIKKINQLESIGLILKASTYIIQSYDLQDRSKTEQILNILTEAEVINKLRFNKYPDLKLETYYKGIIDGIKSYYFYIDENWVKIFSNGLSAIKNFESLYEYDKENGDALIALGIYRYWKNRKTEFLNLLPFYKDDKENALQLLEEGITKNSYFKYLGLISLGWIYIDMKKPYKVLDLCSTYFDEYPENRIITSLKARAYEDIDIKKAIFFYKKLLNSIRESDQNGINEVIVLHILAQKEYSLNNYKETLSNIDEIYKIKLSYESKNLLKDRFKRIESLRDKTFNEMNKQK